MTGIEAFQLLQHPDQAVGVVAIGLQVEAQPGLQPAGVVVAVAERGAIEARFQW
jgi:hypothetical protein